MKNHKRILPAVTLLTVLVSISSLNLVMAPRAAGAPFPAPLAGEMLFECDAPPGQIEGWVRVAEEMADSGCPPADGECWTTWILARPLAWYEDVAARRYMFWGFGNGNPPAYYPNPVVADPRAFCRDRNCDLKWAEGMWYVNRVARPVFPERPVQQGGNWVFRCEWRLDASKHYWFFGETGYCYGCECDEATPVPGSTPEPPVTLCASPRETPIPPTHTPPPPTQLPPPPQARVEPFAWVRSPRTPGGTWYRSTSAFYWLWQTQLLARLWADAEVLPPPGCTWAQAEVVATYLEQIGPEGREERVCPSPLVQDPPPPSPADVLYPPEGWQAFCDWRGENEPVRVLWSRFPMPPLEADSLRESSLNQHGVTPFAQEWLVIRYKALVLISYACSGFLQTVPQYHDLTLRVGLVKPVQPWR